MMENHEGD